MMFAHAIRRLAFVGSVGFLATSILLHVSAAPKASNATPASSAKVDFNRDIRPILSDNCFACHGPDAQEIKGKLRLDEKEHAFKAGKSGELAIVPGKASESEVFKRVATTDDDDRMPPAKTGKKLSAKEIDLLKRWIDGGAEYQSHWAFNPPTRPERPTVKNRTWPRNEIDYFVLARLEKEGLKPSPEADKTTLLRRATLDLTGLPPTPAEVDAFLADKSPGAYEKVLDRLLESPHYGERMAVEWLDAARYADTHGYHIDSARDMTHWRDWVIEAFNSNQPFDQFTIEQLAGDLLPNATVAQKIASGFNRNHMINYEGGAIAEEYHTAYLIDRVNTTATVWLGLTMACAQCHDHKYDPLSMKDYYSFYAFFNNVPEKGLDGRNGNAEPMLKVPTPTQSGKLEELKAQVTNAQARLKKVEDKLASRQADWEKSFLARNAEAPEPTALLLRFPLDESLTGQLATGTNLSATFEEGKKPKWVPGKIGKALELNGRKDQFSSVGDAVNFDTSDAFSYGCWVRQTGKGTGALLAKMDDGQASRGFDLLLGDGKLHLHLIQSWPGSALRIVAKSSIPQDTWVHVFATYDGSGKASGAKLYVNGASVPFEVTNDNLSGSIRNKASLNLGKRSESWPFKGALDDVRLYHRALTSDEVAALAEKPILELAKVPADQRTKEQEKQLTEHYRERYAPEWSKANGELTQAKKAVTDFEKSIPTSMIMGELAKPRETFMLVRGEYDKKGSKVTAATPAVFGPLPPGTPANRLGLAQWLVSSEQPLTARVTVNRYWQMYFGNGIVKSAENFGSQADWPTHPDLLDWLATEFVRIGWNVKAMQKLIMMSAAYRQSSVVSQEALERDPENQLLSRGPRLRLPAEFIRDQALAASGLLNQKIGGASVFPYQPAGLWEELMAREDNDNFTAQKYRQSKGADLYRRSMYTFWKRTSPPSTLGTLDAPDRQTCVVRRQRTNTPLQALLLMNDPTFVEASRKLAERMITEARDNKQRIQLAYRLAMSRAPKSAETAELLKLYRAQLAIYQQNPEEASRLLQVGESSYSSSLNQAELAAWTIVATTILNLDETITKG